MGGELWSGQAQNWVNSDFEVKFDLEGQGQLPPKTIGTLTKVFCIFGPNLAILAWTGPELSPGQASDWHTDRQTHTHTHTQTQATTIPEGQNWPRVKMKPYLISRSKRRHIYTKTTPVDKYIGCAIAQQWQVNINSPKCLLDYFKADHSRYVRIIPHWISMIP